MNTTMKGESRFENDATRYAAYLETPEGRLRTDLVLAEVQEGLPKTPANEPLHALDLGCGTGIASIRLARLGIHVTLLDSSPAMLALAERSILESGLREKTVLKAGEAAEAEEILRPRSFDVILCHNVLEYVDDTEAVLRSAAGLMRNASSVLSILVRNQAGEVLKAAIQTGDLAAAEKNLDAEWGRESLYGGKVRYFTPATMEAMLKDASLSIIARRGVRVVSDYLPEKISRPAGYERIFALERRLGQRQEFFGVARYLHYLACRGAAGLERGG